jgi:C-terminal processing protease CtpA/Prc
MAESKQISPTYSAYCGVGIDTSRRSWEGGADSSIKIGLVNAVGKTPAQRAGIQENDELLAVLNDTGWHEVKAANQEQIQSWIRGTQGTPVVLRIRRAMDGKEVEVPLQRALIIELPRWSKTPARYEFELEPASRCSDLSQLPSRRRVASAQGL